jgi:flagellar biosynthesis protein FlhG
VATDESDHGDDELIVTDDEAHHPAAAPEITNTGTVPRARAKLIALAAGRGGTGQSLLAANFAVYLAQAGKKIVALDAEPAGGPLHQLLGATRPPRGFGEFLRGKATGLSELISDTPVAGVGLIAGEGGAFGAARPRLTTKVALAAIAALDVDYVVIDLGPPDSTLTLDLFLAADIPILVTIPDPASIEATYRFAKSAFIRKLRTVRGLDRVIGNAAGPPQGALDIYRSIKETGGPAERLVHEIRRFRPTFIMNQTRTLPDQKLGGFMATAARRRLGHSLEYLGHVESDETVWLAARRRRSLIAEYPEGKASKNIERLGRRLLSLDGERERERPITGPLRT